jgi:CO dehydrogenase maturation factor
MKIAVSGKGGVGKSTVSAALALLLARRGERVLALDADPDANFANALGYGGEPAIVPISKQIELIEERTGSKTNEYGKIFKLNPEVSDVADRFATCINGVDLLVLGAADFGGGGCACPENAFMKALVTDLVLYRNETLIMDMEAGVEHLGRATASGVDVMLVVAEPGQRSIDCAKTVARMGAEIGIKKFVYVGNKVQSEKDEAFIRDSLGKDKPLAVAIPYSEKLRMADRPGVSILDGTDEEMMGLFEKILNEINN